MNQTQLIEELSAALDDATAPLHAPAGMAERARRQVRGRRFTRGLAATVPAVGLATGLVVTVGAPHKSVGTGSGASTARPRERQQPTTLTVAYVTERAIQAEQGLGSVIIKATENASVEWSDQTTRQFRYLNYGADGKLVSDELEWYSGDTIRNRIYVDYATKTWWRLAQKTSVTKAPPKVPTPLPAAQDNAHGRVIILGHRTVDGKDTIEVEYAPPHGFKRSASQGWATQYTWLDASTYRPVRTTIRDGLPNDNSPQTTDLAYLPATANLAVFTLSPPPGFKQVAPPLFNGDGQPGLGMIP
jgi:hypothetical protein